MSKPEAHSLITKLISSVLWVTSAVLKAQDIPQLHFTGIVYVQFMIKLVFFLHTQSADSMPQTWLAPPSISSVHHKPGV